MCLTVPPPLPTIGCEALVFLSIIGLDSPFGVAAVEAWEVLREAVEKVGVKRIAARLKVSSALVYKWCQEPPSEEDPEGSGAKNPLDRLRIIIEATQDARLVNWLCHAAGGFFAQNPCVEPKDRDEELLVTTHRVVQDFSEVLTKISNSIENDGQITREEADIIRQAWESLKAQGECFVAGCERGMYMAPINPKTPPRR